VPCHLIRGDFWAPAWPGWVASVFFALCFPGDRACMLGTGVGATDCMALPKGRPWTGLFGLGSPSLALMTLARHDVIWLLDCYQSGSESRVEGSPLYTVTLT
jgi:hypothetical protein